MPPTGLPDPPLPSYPSLGLTGGSLAVIAIALVRLIESTFDIQLSF
jgi:hypothetical protein